MTDPSEPADAPATSDDGCGYSFDHDAVDTHRGADGTSWECRRCGAEGWEPAENEKSS